MAKRGSRKSKRDVAIRRAVETRALYAYEEKAFRDQHLNKRQSIRQLRTLAKRVWEGENGDRFEKMPEIVAGDGTRFNNRWISFCEGRTRIVLARHERTKKILLHELVHGIGNFMTHGPAFRKRYFEYLARYGGRLSARSKAALQVNLRTLRH